MSGGNDGDSQNSTRPAIIPYGSRTGREDMQKQRLRERERILSGGDPDDDKKTGDTGTGSGKLASKTASTHTHTHADASAKPDHETVRGHKGGDARERKPSDGRNPGRGGEHGRHHAGASLQGGLRPAMSSERPSGDGEAVNDGNSGREHEHEHAHARMRKASETNPTDSDVRRQERRVPRLLPQARLSMPAVRADHTAAGDPRLKPVEDAAPDPVTRGRFAYPSAAETASRQAGDADDAQDLDVDAALGLCVDMGASDVFIKPDSPVWYQVNGITFPSDRFRRVDKDRMENVASDLITAQLGEQFTLDLELDASYVIDDGGPHQGARFRMSMIRSDNHGVEMVFRYISPKIETPETLGLSSDVMEWINLPRGLVLVCGPTGSGKSTSLASMIRVMQTTQRRHILTIENPVETVYPRDGLSLVDQREVGVDTLSFESSLTSAMREAPDVILVGEMRTREEIDATLQAADSGHLTFSTLHTKSAEETIQRIASRFTGDDRRDVLDRLASNLVGVMSQQLLQRADGEGRVAVHEVMHVDRRISEFIREGDVTGIRNAMESRKASMDHELVWMMRDGTITEEEARSHAVDIREFTRIADGDDDDGDDDAGGDERSPSARGRLRMRSGLKHVSPLSST